MGKDAEELTPRARRRTLAIALMNCAYGQSERPARLTPATIREYKASPGEGNLKARRPLNTLGRHRLHVPGLDRHSDG